MNNVLSLVDYVNNKFKNKLENSNEHLRWLEMASFFEEIGDDALIWDYKEAYDKYISINGLSKGSIAPTIDNWKLFLSDDIINEILTKLKVKSKYPVLRKIIENINENSTLSQSDMKALIALKDLIKDSDNQNEKVVYVQYLAPVRYDNSNVDKEQLVKDLIFKNETE